MADEEQVIDPRVYIKQLAPDQLGMFEPLSGMMLLNVPRVELAEAAKRFVARTPTDFDLAIINTINHEAYHFAQVASSGYVFHREARLLMVFNASEPLPEVAIEPEMQALLDAARQDAGDDPELLLRYQRVVAMLQGHNQFALYDQVAAKGDHSVVGARMPGFFAHMKELVEGEQTTNAAGLSILGVLEGSAVVHANLLMHENEDATPYIEAELKTLPPVYRQLYDLTVARAGERALELLLPAVALALRFMQPHDAYLPLLSLLGQSASGDAIEHGRRLIERLPEISEGGHLLGTALDLRRMYDGYRLYDSVLGKLESREWGIDSYDFLAQPKAMFAVGKFPLGIVTTDGYFGPLERAESAARMVLMGAVLRSQSRRRAQREFQEFQAGWGRSVIERMFGAGPRNEE
jgi:hypothetical protein